MTVKSMKEEGDRHYKGGNFLSAVEYYSKAISSASDNEPDIYLSYSNRCACYLQIGEFQKAYYDANACVRIKPAWPKGYNRKGSCLVRLGRIDDAIEAYERAVQLDGDNVEALNALAKLRTSSSSSGGSQQQNTGRVGGDLFSRIQTQLSAAYQQFLGMDWGSVFAALSATVGMFYSQATERWNRLSPDTRRYVQIGLGLLLAYYFLFHRSSSSYGYGGDYYPQYGGGYGYGGGGGGLSWTTWAAVMFGAYKIPPMLPDLLGEQFARPFFGMSWTTFMWLLNMVTGSRGGGRFMGGGYGGGMRPGGGMFGRRRY